MIKPQGYDDWIDGMAVTDDDELVITRFAEGRSSVAVFDVATGARTHEVAVPHWLFGLACVAGDD